MESGSVPFDLAGHLRLRSAWRLPSYHRSRRVGEAVNIANEPLYVSHSSTESGRVVGPLRDAGCWLEAVEDNDASPLAAACLG